MRNQLLIGYSTDEMFSIDTIEGLDINITKNIYSIEDPSKRLSDFTKTIEIPGSKGNDNIFGALFDVNFHIRDSQQLNPDFNPARKAVCQYIQDEHIQIDGYCQLTDIKILNENKVIYVIVIYGQNADLFSKIGDKTLNDITGYGATLDTPITSGTFNWNDTEIQASWVTASNGYLYYPMLNRGLGFTSRPSGTYLGGAWGVDYNFFKPWAYARTLFTSILKEAGFRWSSNFINSDIFKKLIVECDISKFVMATDTMLATRSNAVRSTNQTLTMSSDGVQFIYDNYAWIFNSIVLNNASEYNGTTGTFTIANEGQHDLNYTLDIELNTSGLPNTRIETWVIRKRAGVYQLINTQVTAVYPSGSGTISLFCNLSTMIDFLAGDEFRICARVKDASNVIVVGAQPSISAAIGSSQFTFNESGRYMYGTVNDISPIFYPMKQTDFVMGIVKMFNLYIEPQTDGSLLIEPRDSFYTDVVTDWTDKLDTSKDFVIKPQGLLNVKQIDFNYQQGLTDASKAFNHATGLPFGYERVIFTNDFVKDIKKVDLPFICEPLQVQSDQGIILMRTDYNGASEEITPKPMIAFAGGLVDNKGASYRYYDAGLNTYTDKTQYAYAGFLDNPYTPLHDLTFGYQELYFHTINNELKLTNNGDLYSKYHKKQWTEIGDRNSKLVECWMKLNTYDIATLSFRQAYWIDKAAYRLLEVQDYSPNGDTTTKCLFLKLNEAETLTPSTSTTIGNNGGGNTGGGGGTGGDYTGGDLGNGMNVQQVTNGLWQGGAGNKIQNSVGVLVSGSNNSVGYGCFNIQIKGSNNTIYPGLSNITLINCDSLEITESDVQYIDNIKIDLTTPINGYGLNYNSTTGAVEFTAPGGGGGGDMYKSTYDVDNDGIVDNAETINILARNSTGGTLRRGYIVYLEGSTGYRPNAKLAQANTEGTSSGTFGVVISDILNNADGNICALGTLHNLDTRTGAGGNPYPFTTLTLADGDKVYLDPNNAGYVTNVKPTAPNHLVYIGVVARTSPTNGRIVYRIINGFEMDELHDVSITGVADGEVIAYETASSLYKNKNIGAILNNTSAATPNDTDIVATAQSSILKKITWANVKAFLKTYFDTIYPTTGAAVRSLLGVTTLSGSNTGDQTTTAGLTNSTDKNLVTDAQLVVIGNTSGTNTGDNSANTRYSGLKSVYRMCLQATGSHIAGRVAGTYFIPLADALGITGTGTLYAPAIIRIDSADYPTIDSLAPKFRIKWSLMVNDVAPTGNFTVGLYPITRPATSGGAGLDIYTMGTVVSGSNGSTFTAPLADSMNNGVSSDFALPADGYYVLGVVTTATVATSSHLHINAQLQVHNA